MAYQSLADLGHSDESTDPRSPASAVEVLQAMKALRPERGVSRT
jgi:hypothetical protein